MARGKKWPQSVRTAVLITVIAVSGTASVYFGSQQRDEETRGKAVSIDRMGGGNTNYSYDRLENPPRTVVRDGRGRIVATLTDGARSVALTGKGRTFEEPRATEAKINTNVWVRLLPDYWKSGEENAAWFRPWLDKALADTSPDMFAISMQYIEGASAEKDAKGVRFRGDASFGPIAPSGAGRLERSDFFQYLGVPWSFVDGVKYTPDTDRYGAVDCSGFVRLVYGYRMGYPMRGVNTRGPGLPRRAYAIAEFGPGVSIIPNRKQRNTSYDLLQPGDLIFFEVEDDEDQLDHTGIYLGIDSEGHHRFISSRERINGPTMGDTGGASLLDGNGKYAQGFRAARRI
ncbi:NlpC/P60 family protein [Kibdelosporangium phytohabitans]|uniref:NlpC/P60 domain-containing protein n=1 Tax=Kibdelosporangium phytohabitans TaxID=860235 RepID=A0A0N7F3T9_9PSEU|nr:NlpC/P60 family protein [Kibdelosporangium phytohabitans]ALG09559.1 hypothetical protein AOZ06_24010 [Kibdelosporangium phytohabitans]MBE1469124.1 hypothetical protein [Kibdelosporangium phytohabitans]